MVLDIGIWFTNTKRRGKPCFAIYFTNFILKKEREMLLAQLSSEHTRGAWLAFVPRIDETKWQRMVHSEMTLSHVDYSVL